VNNHRRTSVSKPSLRHLLWILEMSATKLLEDKKVNFILKRSYTIYQKAVSVSTSNTFPSITSNQIIDIDRYS